MIGDMPLEEDLASRKPLHKEYFLWVLVRICDESLVFCDGSPSVNKEGVLKLAVQRARDNGFNYRVVPFKMVPLEDGTNHNLSGLGDASEQGPEQSPK